MERTCNGISECEGLDALRGHFDARIDEVMIRLDRIERSRTVREKASAHADAIQQVWDSLDVVTRIDHVMAALDTAHNLHATLVQALALERMLAEPQRVIEWVQVSPTTLADAVKLIDASVSESISFDASGENPLEQLAASLVAEVEQHLRCVLEKEQIRLFSPNVGDTLTADHEVISEERGVTARGTVARTVRPGIVQRDLVLLPAQVVRSTGSGGMQSQSLSGPKPDLEPAASIADGFPPMDLQLTQRAGSPEWLRELIQKTACCEEEPVVELVSTAATLPSLAAVASPGPGWIRPDQLERLKQPLEALLPWLGMRYSDGIEGVSEPWGAVLLSLQEALVFWLSKSMDITLISPRRGEPFNGDCMIAVESRRTVHLHEAETVARIDRIGLACGGTSIIPAQVVRYITGDVD